jgi:lysophospholipase L1-like esterase
MSARFPAQTVEILKGSNIHLRTPEYIATTGWTTLSLMNAINAENPKGPYDVVSLLIGVNDQYQGLDTAGYRVRFTSLLMKSIALAGNEPSRVFVLSIPDYSATPFVSPGDKARVSKEIDNFNVVNREITLKNNVTYIDITPGSREAATNSSLVANDNLHPSGTEYRRWAERLAVEMKKVLQ